MGLLKHLLFWPVTGPSFLTRFSLERVHGVVREELTDDTPIKEALLELQLQLEAGEIDDEEYVEQEAILMRQLREVRHWREEFGMAIPGGPVRVADTGPTTSEPDDSTSTSTSTSTDRDSAEAAGPRVYGGGDAAPTVDIHLDFDE